MSFKLEEIFETFIEETFENLASIDDSLLSLNLEAPDPILIDKIFRAVHNIKGASTLFKLSEINQLMHTIETFLDKIRINTLALDRMHLDLMFQSSDLVRTRISTLQQKQPFDIKKIQQFTRLFEEAVNTQKNLTTVIQEPSTIHPSNIHSIAEEINWHIEIFIQKEIFNNNLRPELAFLALKELTEDSFYIQINKDLFPSFDSFNPLQCYFGWVIKFHSSIATEEAITNILSWVFQINNILITKNSQPPPIFSKPSKIPKEKSINIQKKASFPQKGHDALKVSTIRIPINKIDALMNSISELFITKSILNQKIKALGNDAIHFLEDPIELLEKNTLSLQNDILQIRMIPIAFATNRFPRMIFDIAHQLGKEVNFAIHGEQTEIDKTLIEKITDPLLHLIRNSIDHGIESPEVRLQKGKKRAGTLELYAYQEENNVVIEITDDGCGIHPETIRTTATAKGLISENTQLTSSELYALLFKAGFSTKTNITETSGRGVGLDVVEKNIQDLGGSIELVSTPDIGTTFKLKLPLTMLIIECQIIQVGAEIFNIPLSFIIEMSAFNSKNLSEGERGFLYFFEEKYIPMIYLDKLLNIRPLNQVIQKKIIVIQSNKNYYALLCDELPSQQPIVIKTLEENYCKIQGIIGATIMGDGHISLILDINEIILIDTTQQYQLPSFFTPAILGPGNKSLVTPDNLSGNATVPFQNYDFLCFSLEHYEFALNMSSISDILLLKHITPLPFSPPYLLGVINNRGNIIPIVDLGNYFDLFSRRSTESINPKSFIVVITIEIHNKTKKIGLLADTITDMHCICKEDIHSSSTIGYLTLDYYIDQFIYIKNRIIPILNPSYIFNLNQYGAVA